ncbi:MAG: WYL domain-containing protein [Muribaculaceae bacterium]|nr:WYL domain-containing protein [Muribaculaceae bacterium]
MRVPALFKEYIWLVNTIRKAGDDGITFAEINEKWLETELSEGVELARSTFNRHKNSIEDIFGLIIDCNRLNGYRYFISNEEVLGEDSIQNWMLNTLTVNNIIGEALTLQDRILLQPAPVEGDYLKMVIEAMKKSVKLAVDYRKYGDDEPRHLTFEPYCIKLFKQRWYILGHFHRNAIADRPEVDYFGVFSFDRILNMSLTDEKFQMDPSFNAQAYFEECFGVLVNDDTVAQRIVIRVFGDERFYVRDLPIHKSQREIGQGEDYTDFELFMRPTIDLSTHFVSRSFLIKVLEPQWLADEIHHMHMQAVLMYEAENK